MWNGCSEMRKRKGKERETILNERDMEEKGQNAKERTGGYKDIFFLGLLFLFLDKTVRRNKTLLFSMKR
jgi:hypothetical protein